MDARRVCQIIGINLYTLNFSKEFKKDIVDDFINEYSRGNTPNPCVRCNKLVKLGLLIKKARKLGYDYVASGHYARLKREIPNSKLQIPKIKLYRAKDKEKDQSYFLWMLTQEQLKHLIFPLGNYTKEEVRKMAKKYKLPVAEKSESQEVCFIPEKSHNEFLKRYLKLKKGKIKTLDGKTIGEHQGLPLYTIGQRRGVEIGGTGPYYVAKLDYKTNTLYVVNNFDDPVLYSNELIARDVNWIAGTEPNWPLKCEAVIRYRHKPVKCVVTQATKNKILVKFKEKQRAITPGQSVVFYSGDEVLGGGIIEMGRGGKETIIKE
jgi:tRNA-specific 2-thiouridylase